MTMTKNYCLDQLKARRTNNQKLADDNYADSEQSFDKNIEDRDSIEWVGKLMSRLPEQQQILIQMQDVEGYEYAGMAEVMEMNETAIRVALSRARKKR
jgi:RNA polymerase sigma-70 factor (ECF subfamily)